MANELAVKEEFAELSAIRDVVNKVQYLKNTVFKEGTHYGVIPGTGNKPSLLKPGAEKICTMLGYVAKFDYNQTLYDGGHREYSCKCILANKETGQEIAEGNACCSTLESKYRYRWQTIHGKKERVENRDIADQWNTVLKMAEKRAFVDAVLRAANVSDIFTQDIEDLPSYMFSNQPQSVEIQPEYVEPAPQQAQQPVQQPAENPVIAQRKEQLKGLIEQFASLQGREPREVWKEVVIPGDPIRDYKVMDEQTWVAYRGAICEGINALREAQTAYEGEYEG